MQVASAIGLALAITLWVRQLDVRRLASTLEHARTLPLGAVVLIALAGIAWKAAFWQVALSTMSRVPYWPLLRYAVAATVGSILAPARAGEPFRLWILRVRHGVPYSETLAVVGLEKLGDVVTLVALVTPLPWLVPRLSSVVRPSLLLLAALPLAAALAIAWVRRHPRWSKLPLFLGLRLFDRPFRVAIALACVVSAWLCDLATVELVLFSLGLRPTLTAGLLVLLITNLAIALPLTPGNVGAHELGSALALKMLGVESEAATAFALMYHGLHTIPVLLLGFVDARRLLVASSNEPAAVNSSSG